MKISEMITDRYKLRIPPTVYYDLLADVQEVEEEQEPTTKNDLGDDCISRKAVIDELKRYFHDEYYQRTSIQNCRDCFIEDVLNHLPSVTPQLSSELEKNSKKLEKDFDELDCISRKAVLDKIQRLINAEQYNINENGDYMNYARERVNAYEAIQFFVENDCLCPSVTSQEPTIKALGEELRKVREGIKDGIVLYGYDKAVAICNKYLSEMEDT